MKKNFSDSEHAHLNELIAQTEKRTGAQMVLACVDRCDSYPELPWKAFAFGAALSGFLFLFLQLLFSYRAAPVLLAIMVTLAGGAVFALLTILLPQFARWFLSAHRIESEVKQYAQALFLEHELFATRSRKGILLLVTLFERRIEILPDRGLGHQLTDQNLRGVLDEMIPLLKRAKIYLAFEVGLEQLGGLMEPAAAGSEENELPDQIIEEKGA
ncbi:TPM domain-containing protein [candidate division KSB1 bacterium]|nr:TPM domain-containing protein [candidate division KSB1 bacterium]